jgi:hypothetical protein
MQGYSISKALLPSSAKLEQRLKQQGSITRGSWGIMNALQGSNGIALSTPAAS